MLEMGRVYVIRHKYFTEGLSIRRIAKELAVSRNTVRKYLFQDSEPKRKESTARARPVLQEVSVRIEELLEEWKDRTTDKQRITGSRVHQQLLEEGYSVGITTVREYLAEKRRKGQEVFIPLVWDPGDAVQVDFFEVTVEVAGKRQKVWKFLMRLMYSGRDFVWLYERCNQIAFLDGHVRAFMHFGGVTRRGIYDNLTAAVKRRVGLEAQLSARFLALCTHYVFEPCFARPGEGHDKGGVEARGKGLRLQHLTPIPRGESLEEIAGALLAEVDQAACRRKDREGRSVAERFEEERRVLRALPERGFIARRSEPVVISRQALVRVEAAEYSVPSRWACLPAMAHIGVADILLECRGQTLMLKKVGRGGRNVRYRHYLGELARKPQAVRQVASRLFSELGPPYQRLWSLLSDCHGEREAARVMAKLLGAVVQHGEQELAAVLQELLRHEPTTPVAVHTPNQVVVPEALSHYQIEAPRATSYDHLLLGAGHE
jgi:transposase